MKDTCFFKFERPRISCFQHWRIKLSKRRRCSLRPASNIVLLLILIKCPHHSIPDEYCCRCLLLLYSYSPAQYNRWLIERGCFCCSAHAKDTGCRSAPTAHQRTQTLINNSKLRECTFGDIGAQAILWVIHAWRCILSSSHKCRWCPDRR